MLLNSSSEKLKRITAPDESVQTEPSEDTGIVQGIVSTDIESTDFVSRGIPSNERDTAPDTEAPVKPDLTQIEAQEAEEKWHTDLMGDYRNRWGDDTAASLEKLLNGADGIEIEAARELIRELMSRHAKIMPAGRIKDGVLELHEWKIVNALVGYRLTNGQQMQGLEGVRSRLQELLRRKNVTLEEVLGSTLRKLYLADVALDQKSAGIPTAPLESTEPQMPKPSRSHRTGTSKHVRAVAIDKHSESKRQDLFEDEDHEKEPVTELSEWEKATADLDSEADIEDSVRLYLSAIGKTELLTAADEVELAKRIEAGLYAKHLLQKMGDQYPAGYRTELKELMRDGAHAQDHFLRANLRLVVSLAKRYARSEMPLLDLIQEGNLGLMHAIEKFDYQKGYKFSTYATRWIGQAIARSIADKEHTIRKPVHYVEDIKKLGRLERELFQELGREATADELAFKMKTTPAKVLEIQQNARDTISLDRTVGDGEDSLGQFVADRTTVDPDSTVINQQKNDQLRSALSTLGSREAAVVRMRHGLDDGLPKTLDEIGAVFKLSRARISQIEREAMAKLRHPSRAQVLRDYLDD